MIDALSASLRVCATAASALARSSAWRREPGVAAAVVSPAATTSCTGCAVGNDGSDGDFACPARCPAACDAAEADLDRLFWR